MNHDERDDLWHLLGRARPGPTPSAFFARNVLRAIRQAEPAPEPSFLEWMRRGWNAVAAGAAALVLLFMAIRPSPVATPTVASHDAAIDQVLASDEFAVIANLDALLTVDDNEIWLASIQP